MFLQFEGRLVRAEIVEFFMNCEVNHRRVISKVKGVKISFDDKKLGENLMRGITIIKSLNCQV